MNSSHCGIKFVTFLSIFCVCIHEWCWSEIFFSCDVFIWFWYKKILPIQSELGRLPPSTYRKVVQFFLKYLGGLTNEAIWAQVFILGKFSIINSISCYRSRFSNSSWVSFSKLVTFWRLCLLHLSCIIYWHEIVLFSYNSNISNVGGISFLEFLILLIIVFSLYLFLSYSCLSLSFTVAKNL